MNASQADRAVTPPAQTPTSLPDWQAHLAAHFESLKGQRSRAGWPVFALEHGLDEAAVQQLEVAVRDSLLLEQPSSSAYLPWVVYAAEFGYGYTGYEYWKSFAAKTPRWLDGDSSRAFFRRAFEKFALMYSGTKPSGAWAAWFKIIAWPITHGIVPRDLQRHLVKLLYDERYDIPRFISRGEVAELGKYLHGACDAYSDRFRQFAANEELIGQIATALLVQRHDEEALISAPTLERIVADINRERAAAEWLYEARSTTKRLRIGGLSPHSTLTPAFGQQAFTATDSSARTDQPRVQRSTAPVRDARVLLRPTASEDWELWIEVPDLTSLVHAYPRLRDVLRGRGRLCGSNRPMASSVLLYGGIQPFPVAAWPASGEPFIQYDATPGDLRQLLDSLFCPPAGSSWLFKLNRDGQAVLLKSNVVHPGESYILLSRESHERPAHLFSKVPVRCAGVTGLRFDLPRHLDDVWPELLGRLDLTPSKALTVWPAGLPPAAWDGEGTAEWLMGEELILGVSVDHPIRGLLVSINDGLDREIPVQGGGDLPIFIVCDALQRGRHRIAMRTAPADATDDSLSGILDLVIRPPRQHAPGHSRQEAVLFVLDPPAPTLEDLWGNRLELQINGPPNHRIKGRFCLFERGQDIPLVERTFELALPVDTAKWRHAFERIQNDTAVQARYDTAYICRIEYDLGTLGCFSIQADRAFTPLRWIVHQEGGDLMARLIDDTGTDDAIVTRVDCHRPDKDTPIQYEDALDGLRVDPPGSLYVAEADGQCSSIVVAPPRKRLSSLQDLALVVVPSVTSPTPNDLCRHLTCARRWEEAHTAGSALSSAHRERVLSELQLCTSAAFCGDRWSRLEQAVHSGATNADLVLRAMQDQVTEPLPPGLRSALLGEFATAARMDLQERVRFFSDQLHCAYPGIQPTTALQASSHLTAGDDSPQARRDRTLMFYEFALRTASSPAAALSWAGTHAKSGIRLLLSHTDILRIARIFVLGTHLALQQDKAQRRGLYAGWEWP